MTKPIVGKVMGNIANDTAHACYHNDGLFEAAINDLLDGDNDNTRATLLMNLLRGRNFKMFHIHERIASGDVSTAELAAMQLAAVDKVGT